MKTIIVNGRPVIVQEPPKPIRDNVEDVEFEDITDDE